MPSATTTEQPSSNDLVYTDSPGFQEGYYWRMYHHGMTPEVVHVKRDGIGLGKWHYYKTGDAHGYAVESGRGLWAGPIKPPTKVTAAALMK